MPGVEVVQLYIRLRGTSVAQPVRALAGFQRIALAPGESRQVSFALGPQAFALWDAAQHLSVEAASVSVWISANSAQGEGAELPILP